MSYTGISVGVVVTNAGLDRRRGEPIEMAAHASEQNGVDNDNYGIVHVSTF
jgi:hypothetical protein